MTFPRLDRLCVRAFLTVCFNRGLSVTIIDRDDGDVALDPHDLLDSIDEMTACDECIVRVEEPASVADPRRARFFFVYGNGDEEAIATIADLSDNALGKEIYAATERGCVVRKVGC